MLYYKESIRIPLIISQPGTTKPGYVDDKNLIISNGFDIVPTICEYAGIELPYDLPGKSLKKIAEGNFQELFFYF